MKNLLLTVTDKRTGKALSLREFSVSFAEGAHLVFGWETYAHYYPADAQGEFFEVSVKDPLPSIPSDTRHERSDAELTLRHAILMGYTDAIRESLPPGPKEIQNCILKAIFDPIFAGAVQEYLNELKQKQNG